MIILSPNDTATCPPVYTSSVNPIDSPMRADETPAGLPRRYRVSPNSALADECRRATELFFSFADPRAKDSVISPDEIRNAKGLAFLTVTKAGIAFSFRAGTGLVIARLPDGSWSAPSAISTAGAGAGPLIGYEKTETVIIMNTRAAVESFMTSGSLQLGGSAGVAAGPVGRSIQGAGAVSSSGVSATCSYSRSKGVFTGVAAEGNVMLERKDLNKQAYGGDPVSARQLLSGEIPRPEFAHELLRAVTLTSRIGAPSPSASTSSSRQAGGPSTLGEGARAHSPGAGMYSDYVPDQKRERRHNYPSVAPSTTTPHEQDDRARPTARLVSRFSDTSSIVPPSYTAGSHHHAHVDPTADLNANPNSEPERDPFDDGFRRDASGDDNRHVYDTESLAYCAGRPGTARTESSDTLRLKS